MLLRIYFLLFFTFCCTAAAIAETFVVTSNADAGPGTLREALTKAAANGSAEKDFINFNLPDVSEAGRTIVVLAPLPLLSSKLVIDASTQLGNKIGISDAKIIMKQRPQPFTYSDENTVFVGNNVAEVEIYGFHFFYFLNASIGGCPVIFRNSTDIKIGKKDKGNVFGMVLTSISINSSDRIIISSNQFGIDPVSLQVAGDHQTTNLQISGCKNLVIGGDYAGDGNLFVSADVNHYTIINDVDNCLFKNNTLGYFASSISLGITIRFINIQNLSVINNNLNNGSTVYLRGINLATIKGNKTFIDTRNYRQNSIMAATFSLENVKKAVIGGDAPEDVNEIHYPYFMQYESYGNGYAAIFAYGCYDILMKKNSISCKSKKDVYEVVNPKAELPVVSISTVNSSLITGKATPGSEVEVFSDGECQLCEPNKYLGSAIADLNGLWSFALSTSSSGYTASASLNGRTSLFAKVGYDVSSVSVVNPSCGNNNGSISGVKTLNTTKIEWKNEQGVIVGHNANIDNLSPGKYFFIAYLSEQCYIKSDEFVLKDVTPIINDSRLLVKNVSCNGDGVIKGLYIQNVVDLSIQKINWINQNNVVVGSSLDLESIVAGTYKLQILTNSNCITEYGPVTIKNTTGPNIDETAASIQSTPCNQSAGSVTNLTITGGTGTLKYSWKNAQNQEVSTAKDLQNQPAGKYTLEVSDDSACGPVYSSAFEITETNGISVDVSGVSQTNTTCNNNNGSITGITAQGGNTYEWRNGSNQLVGSALNLSNVGPGKYHLIISNNSCSKESPEYTIVKKQINTAYTSNKTIKAASCSQNNGSIQVVFNTQQPKALRWENSAGVTLGQNALLQNLDDGTYQLYVTDDNGCESAYEAYTVSRITPMQITLNSEVKTDDQCSQKLGSIKSVNITGGQQPYAYKWLNNAGATVAATANLVNIPEGTYTLQVTDATGCDMVSQVYTIENQSSSLTAPMVSSNIQICGPGQAIVNIVNPGTEYTYRIYETRTASKAIAEQKSGKLTVNVKDSRSLYISRLLGSCESQRAELRVSVGVSGTDIPNVITPNGDGVNDLWEIKGMENYPAAQVQLFNRNGQIVFESRGYSTAFDGTRNGQQLPIGAYYYIINLGSGCSLFSGSLTILR